MPQCSKAHVLSIWNLLYLVAKLGAGPGQYEPALYRVEHTVQESAGRHASEDQENRN